MPEEDTAGKLKMPSESGSETDDGISASGKVIYLSSVVNPMIGLATL